MAVKILRSGDPELARRLAQEARALERVTDPGLVRLLDTGVVDGQAFLVMELVVGSTLAQRLREGSLGVERTAELGAELALALAYVHSQGIVHRDVKPSNIMVDATGHAKLGDFGIAQLTDASTLTVTGTTLGTAAYMAPEQLEHHQVGASADVWSLGMVLLECLTGRRLYEGTPSEVVARRLAGPVPLPADLPVPWSLLLGSLLDHRPEKRLEAAAVADLLATSPFRGEWAPADEAETAQLTAALTALVSRIVDDAAHRAGRHAHPSGGAGAGARDGPAREGGPAAARRPRRPGRGRPGRPDRRSGDRARVEPARQAEAGRHDDDDPSTTTTSTTTTTTTVPTAATALATLVGDVTSGQIAGSVDPGSAQSITTQAQKAVIRGEAGPGGEGPATGGQDHHDGVAARDDQRRGGRHAAA